jgi:protein ImuB
MRLACVFVPQLALQAVLRRTPEARGHAVALVEVAARGGNARVVAATDEARRAGVRVGMTVAQASAACPTLRQASAAAADVAAAEAALADVGYAFAPRIDTDGVTADGAGGGGAAGRVFFDIADLQRLYPLGEGAIAQAIQAQAARVGLGVRVAIASSKGIARVATRARALAVVPLGGERGFLAPLPVAVLEDEASRSGNGSGKNENAIAVALRRWGITTVGALAALPRAEVALRLGEAGARLCRLAAGVHDEPFMPRLPADALEEGIEIDYPIYEIEPLAFVLRGLVDRALARLACRSLACAGLTLRLGLDPRGLDVREVPIAAPTRDSATLLQLVRLDLARRPPAAPVVAIMLTALPARVRSTQLDFLRAAGPAADRLAATIARLAALVGPDNVGTPGVEDTWREEAVTVAPFVFAQGSRAPSASTAAANGANGDGTLVVHRFRPAQEIEVLMGRDGPTALRGDETTARILIAAGPYRMNGEWWRPQDEGGDWNRDYWDVHASDGAVYRLHRDQRDDRWYLDGYYD